MKKLFILSSVLALGALSSFAQGNINAANAGTGVLITIQDTTGVINGGVAAVVGTPATAAGFLGAGKGAVAITLYGAANGTALSTLESSQSILATGFNTSSGISTVQGTEAIGASPLPVTIAAASDEFIFYGSVVSGGVTYSAWTTEVTGVVPATGSTQAPFLFGTTPGLISSFNLIAPAPEPSTIALGGLGAAALLLFRRRK